MWSHDMNCKYDKVQYVKYDEVLELNSFHLYSHRQLNVFGSIFIYQF